LRAEQEFGIQHRKEQRSSTGRRIQFGRGFGVAEFGRYGCCLPKFDSGSFAVPKDRFCGGTYSRATTREQLSAGKQAPGTERGTRSCLHSAELQSLVSFVSSEFAHAWGEFCWQTRHGSDGQFEKARQNGGKLKGQKRTPRACCIQLGHGVWCRSFLLNSHPLGVNSLGSRGTGRKVSSKRQGCTGGQQDSTQTERQA